MTSTSHLSPSAILIQGCRKTASALKRFGAFLTRRPQIKSFASLLTSVHSLSGKLNRPASNQTKSGPFERAAEEVPADCTFLNRLKQQLLTVCTVLAAVPPAVLFAVAGERWIAAEQNVGNDSQRPQVAALVVVVRLALEQGHNFWCHEFCTSDLQASRK